MSYERLHIDTFSKDTLSYIMITASKAWLAYDLALYKSYMIPFYLIMFWSLGKCLVTGYEETDHIVIYE